MNNNITKQLKTLAISIVSLASIDTASAQEKNPLTIGGYLESYYTQDFNRPLNNTRPGFIYSHNRTNEVNINLALLKTNYMTERMRANFAIAAGTYMNANYAAEPGVLKNIYEANAGIKLSKNHELWIDAGIMPSHIGFESAIGKDNWTLARSIGAENSPYFETGAKISYMTMNGKWFISGLILNGWQRIQRVDGNTTPAFGHQLTFKPNDKITLNSSSFIGSDKPDSTRQMRYFHNLYGIFQLNDKVALTVGFDLGAEQKEKNSDDYNIWYTPVVILKYTPSEKASLAMRGEYYQDEKGVIITTGTPDGFQTWGFSLNADYSILSNLVWRTEIRNLSSSDDIFAERDGTFSDNDFAITTALTFAF